MPSLDRDDTSDARLQAIAGLLGVEPEAFEEAHSLADSVEMLTLWTALPNAAEKQAALAYMRLLARGFLK